MPDHLAHALYDRHPDRVLAVMLRVPQLPRILRGRSVHGEATQLSEWIPLLACGRLDRERYRARKVLYIVFV